MKYEVLEVVYKLLDGTEYKEVAYLEILKKVLNSKIMITLMVSLAV